jgi:hypothetical protein
MMGVDSVESSSRQNATKNSIDRGVAGRSMLAEDARARVHVGEDAGRQRRVLETVRGVERGRRASWNRRRASDAGRAYARSPRCETSDKLGCTGDACGRIETARQAHTRLEGWHARAHSWQVAGAVAGKRGG